MRRKLWFATTVSALVSVVFVIGIAPATGSPDSERRKTLHLVVSDPDLTFVDLNGEGETVGDMRVVDSPLLNRDESRQVGHTPLSCIIVDLEQPARCNGELALEKGVITLQGLLTDEQRFAVTGGTGAFAHVTGESRGVVDTSHGVKIRLTVQLRGVR